MSGFLFSYYRPWEDNSNLVSSWLDYAKDQSRARMIGLQVSKQTGLEVGKYVIAATGMQIQSMNRAVTILGAKFDVLFDIQEKINSLLERSIEQLSFLNRRMDLQIEQQRLSNLLLGNITELLKIPNSEKERQYAITYGIKFFVNAAKDEDLYADALENFHKAESMHPQDYFVLHRLGSIYMYVPKYIDVEKACKYFVMAAKYAAVEIDPHSLRSNNLMTNSINNDYTKLISDAERIKFFAADSYNKAALAYYVLGDDEKAVSYQEKALNLVPTTENRFLYAKYLFRQGKNKGKALSHLSRVIDTKPEMANAIILELDMLDNPEVLDFLKCESLAADNELDEIISCQKDKKKAFWLYKAKNESFGTRKGIVAKYKF